MDFIFRYSQIIIFSVFNDTEGRITHWLLFLQRFDFTTAYKKGTSNSNADALSQRPLHYHLTVSAVGTCTSLADSDTFAEG